MAHPYLAHLKNVYPGGHVDLREDSIDAFDAEGKHRVALRKNGAGQWTDVGSMVGASDKFSLDPIPKEARVWKHYSKYGEPGHDGGVRLSEEHEERAAFVKSVMVDGRVPSIAELAKAEKK